jgi:hypothetical protein
MRSSTTATAATVPPTQREIVPFSPMTRSMMIQEILYLLNENRNNLHPLFDSYLLSLGADKHHLAQYLPLEPEHLDQLLGGYMVRLSRAIR